MKRLLIPLVVLLGLLTASVAFAAEHSLNEAFRGIPWGTSEGELGSKYGMVKQNLGSVGNHIVMAELIDILGNPNTILLTKPDDSLSMGNVPVKLIQYHTDNQGKFNKVIMLIDNSYSSALIQLSQQLLGSEALASPREYMWDLGKVNVYIQAKPAAISISQPFLVMSIVRKSDAAIKNQGGGF